MNSARDHLDSLVSLTSAINLYNCPTANLVWGPGTPGKQRICFPEILIVDIKFLSEFYQLTSWRQTVSYVGL